MPLAPVCSNDQVNFYTYTFIGILFLLLKPSQVHADLYQFSDSSCYKLKGSSWENSLECTKNSNTYSLSRSSNLFCAYELQSGEKTKDAVKKVRFYRDLKNSVFIDYNSGRARNLYPYSLKTLLFSKRDLLIKDSRLCKPLGPKTNLSGAQYLLHKPNSFYVLKSGLRKNSVTKKTTTNIKRKKQSPLIKVIPEKSQRERYKSSNSFAISPRLFFERIEGKQITNGTTASLSGNLSPGLNLKFTKGENLTWQYGSSIDLDFHIFDERASEFSLNNNTVQTLALNVFANFEVYKNLSTQFMISVYEDLYYARTSASSIGLEKELVPRLTFSTDLKLYKGRRLNIKLTPKIFYDLAAGPLESGIGYSAPLSIELARESQIWSFGVEYFSITKELEDLELERSALSFFVETRIFF